MIDFQIQFIPECGSTNDEAKKLPIYSVIYAGRQTNGRGRLGRAWSDGSGNLMMSIVLPLEENAHLYSFMAALAVAQSIAFLSPRIKWPNDVLVDGKKICGILLETVDDKLIIGIGLNIESHPQTGLMYGATSLKEHGKATEPKKILDSILQNLNFMIDYYQKKGFKPIRLEWLQFATGIGEAIRVNLPNACLEGVFENIDDTGALILNSDNKRQLITAGDVFMMNKKDIK